MAHRAPKQWCLTKTESIGSFESWRHNLLFTLSLDPNFAAFLAPDAKWAKYSKAAPLRGFTSDPTTDADGSAIDPSLRQTAAQKATMLELLLGQIANYCPVIARNTIVRSSTSMEFIWQAIRMHYGFQSTGARFLDFGEIKMEPGDRYEDLFQRLMAFADDNLLKINGGISHHGEQPSEDEELSPSLENFLVFTWLRLIHEDLPRLVKQRYGTELRSRTLASIRPEISQALHSLLAELHAGEEPRVMRLSGPESHKSSFGSVSHQYQNKSKNNPRRDNKSCPLCKQAGRAYSHYLSSCKFLPESDRKYISKARQIARIITDSDSENSDPELGNMHEEDPISHPTTHVSRVQIRQSPYIDSFVDYHPIRATIDSGATSNLLRESAAIGMGVKITPSSQSALQADGRSPLTVIGETRFTLNRDAKQLTFEGLVVRELDVDMLAGAPFMELNDITIRPAKRQVILSDGTCYPYGSPGQGVPAQHRIRRTTAASVLRAPASRKVVWPGEYVEISLPEDIANEELLALEPRTDRPSATGKNLLWPAPTILSNVNGTIRIPNLSDEPQTLKKHEHFCQVRPVYVPEKTVNSGPPHAFPHQAQTCLHSSAIKLDPDNLLSAESQAQFITLHKQYDNVFNPTFQGYNGASGPIKTVVNMGPVLPPQRKGRLPQYSRDKLVELQDKFDSLEQQGVFARPEDIGITVEYLNPSFLIKKKSGGYRLVTAFSDVGRYSKPQPSLMPNVDSTLRSIAQWKYIICTDLTSAFYQIPIDENSIKFCGVVTPFRGVRAYVRSAMGMPGSETGLEELLCRVLGDLLAEGIVAKIADDLFCGGNTPEELLHNWTKVLQALHRNSLNLSACKTTVCPKTTTILGWTWSCGTLAASTHKVSALATCEMPKSVHMLRSFIGAYKVLARVLPGCASVLAPLDDIVAGKESRNPVIWDESTSTAFQRAQEALSSCEVITLPQHDDQLWIVTDGAVTHGVGATLYLSRQGTPKLAGFFSAKLRDRQVKWLPCEVEALSISLATRHFSPYIIQSSHSTCILTDSKPCVQAYEKLCRGEFSASPRVSTFLSTVSRYQASVRHLAGTANVPSDFASRNAPECQEPRKCQICMFINREEECVVLRTQVSDIIEGKVRLPFTNRKTWLNIQGDCSDLRRTHAHLTQGTRPSKKITSVKDVKRYLNVATIARDGLLVVLRDHPIAASKECIIVPRQVLDGLLTAIHLQLHHPTRHQLKAVVSRYFFALDMATAIDRVTEACHQCLSLRKVPQIVVPQSSSCPPEAIGTSFAADVIKGNKQLIFVLREVVTSFTASCLLQNEQHQSLRDALLQLCISLKPLDGPPVVVRVDPAPGFQSIWDDELLGRHGIQIELGSAKNPNKNPVAEKAVQELEAELLCLNPSGGPTNPVQLAVATALLNTRIRGGGLSSREMWTQRDQFTAQQLPMADQELIRNQHESRTSNHPYSQQSKAPHARTLPLVPIEVGDIVYLVADKNKTRGRDRYLVVATDGPWCSISKFTGSQLRATAYRVKKCACFKVPPHTLTATTPTPRALDFEEDLPADTPDPPPDLPAIPPELSTPNVAPCQSTPANGLEGGLPVQSAPPPAPLVTGPQVATSEAPLDVAPPCPAWSGGTQIWTHTTPSPVPHWLWSRLSLI